jgi:hypothetical protein
VVAISSRPRSRACTELITTLATSGTIAMVSATMPEVSLIPRMRMTRMM